MTGIKKITATAPFHYLQDPIETSLKFQIVSIAAFCFPVISIEVQPTPSTNLCVVNVSLSFMTMEHAFFVLPFINVSERSVTSALSSFDKAEFEFEKEFPNLESTKSRFPTATKPLTNMFPDRSLNTLLSRLSITYI